MDIFSVILNEMRQECGIWFGETGNYWSNLNIDENRQYLQDLNNFGSKKMVEHYFPEYKDVIFSPKRSAGLTLLDLNPGDVVVDAGCMWGALTIPLARAECNVIAIEQTYESIALLKKRLDEENLDNVNLICADLKKINFQAGSFDKFILNGVLEWIPEIENIELKKFYGKKILLRADNDSKSPGKIQIEFLRNTFSGLRNGGSLYLAIENRYDILNFIGQPDAHCNIRFITIMPRWIQNFISNLLLGRPYKNWIYSPKEMKKILQDIGFSQINIHYAFPDYRFPEYILTEKGMVHFMKYNNSRRGTRIIRRVFNLVTDLVCRKLKLVFFAPALIIIAKKG